MPTFDGLTVIPFEGSAIHRNAIDGSLVIQVPKYPVSPTSVNPLLVPDTQVPMNHPGITLSINGSATDRHLFWDTDSIMLQDDDSSDILQTYLDFEFEFRDCLVDIQKHHEFGAGLSGTPYDWVESFLSEYLDTWITANPWSVVCAFNVHRFSSILPSGIGLNPLFGKWAINGFNAAEMNSALTHIGPRVYNQFRKRPDNPYVHGHLEYSVDPVETDEFKWGVRCTGLVCLRFKNGRSNPITMCSFGRADLKPDPITAYDYTDPGDEPSFSEIIESPTPIDPSSFEKKQAVNNLLTGSANHLWLQGKTAIDYMSDSDNGFSATPSSDEPIFINMTGYTPNTIRSYFDQEHTSSGVVGVTTGTPVTNYSSILYFRMRVGQVVSGGSRNDIDTSIHFATRGMSYSEKASLIRTYRDLMQNVFTTTSRVIHRKDDSIRLTAPGGVAYGLATIGTEKYLAKTISYSDPHALITGWYDTRFTDEFIELMVRQAGWWQTLTCVLSWPITINKGETGDLASRDAMANFLWSSYVGWFSVTPSASNTVPVSLK